MDSTEEECALNTTVLNLTDDESLYDSIYTPKEWYIYMIVYPCFLIFGTSTNLSFLFVVIRIPYMRNITNFYLCNLAFADLMLLVSIVVGQMTKYTRSPLRSVNDSVMHCTLELCIFSISFIASTHLVGLVTLERYIAVCHPLKYHLMKGWKRTFKLTILIWIFAIALSSIDILYYNGINEICVIWPDDGDYLIYPITYKTCKVNIDGGVFVLTTQMIGLVIWLIEFIANFAMYFQILRHLHHRASPEGIASDHNAVSTRNQVAFMLVVNGTVFFLCCCMAGSYIILMIMAISGNDMPKGQSGIIYGLIFYTIPLINSSINPIIYNVTNKTYRKAFYLAFTRQNI